MALHIQRAAEGETAERTGQPIFEGQVHGRTLVDGSLSSHFQSALVHFAAGARTRMHRHTSDQMLLVLNGIGKVGDTAGEHVIVSGDSVLIPAETDHWHGAGDTGSPMTHLNVMRADSETTVL
ncbi:MAG: cupin domain-containing protein [Dehalococcoidia bacterium]